MACVTHYMVEESLEEKMVAFAVNRLHLKSCGYPIGELSKRGTRSAVKEIRKLSWERKTGNAGNVLYVAEDLVYSCHKQNAILRKS